MLKVLNVTGGRGKLHSEELPNLYCSQNVIRLSNREKWDEPLCDAFSG